MTEPQGIIVDDIMLLISTQLETSVCCPSQVALEHRSEEPDPPQDFELAGSLKVSSVHPPI